MVGSAFLRRSVFNGAVPLTAERDQLNLTDKEAVEEYFREHQPEAVILSAAKVGGIFANMSQQVAFLVENLQIQNSVILAARDSGIKKLVFLGSSCIYPKNAVQPIDEDSLLTGTLEQTNEAYALAKISGVKLCQYIREERGFDYFSLMPTNLYGPGDNFHLKNSHVPAAFIRKFHEAKNSHISSLTLWGTGKPMREFLHVDDLADAIWFTLQNPPSENLINVGFGTDISISDFAHKISEIVGYQGEIKFDASMPDGTPRKLLNSKRLFDMGWKPKIMLSDGLQSTYKWFAENLHLGLVRGYDK